MVVRRRRGISPRTCSTIASSCRLGDAMFTSSRASGREGFHGIIICVTQTPPPTELERGLVLAVLAPGADDEAELAEVEELVRAAGVEPVGRSSSTARDPLHAPTSARARSRS